MQFEIAKTVPDPERVKATCRAVAKAARVGTAGLLVRVQMLHYSSTRGRCYGDAIRVYRRGKPVIVNGYVKLWFQDWGQLARTFAHELSHLRDARSPRVKRSKEKRATAFADKVIGRIEAAEKEE